MADDATFADLLRQYRLAAGLTQEALAERSGLSVRGIQDLERGVTHPLRDTVARFVRALGLAGEERAAFARAGAPRPPAQERQRAADPALVLLAARAVGAGSGPLLAPLPASLTSLVGRGRELEEVRDLLAASRLVTLTGAGGCGKTRLALETAHQVLPQYRDGVALVELAPLVEPALAPQTVAASVGVREQPGELLLTTLQGALRSRQLLLLLDNCEHLLDACAPLVDALLRTCPELRVLATSREALGITGERSWSVPSLPVPEEGATPEVALQSAAVQLFVERAQAVQPHFALTTQNSAAVVQVCRRLDGIPLALELAAARLPALTVEQIVQRLHQRFDLLTRGSRTAPPRHQTLRATIDWSYDLLSAAERTLFYRLAVFAGGWTLDAAETVGAGDGIGAEGVLNVLSQLVDKSLVLTTEWTAGGTSEVRYHMLETLQGYGLERLGAAGEADLVRGRQRDWARALVERAYLDVMSAAQVAWRNRLKSEHDNLRAVLVWCLEHDTASGLQIAWQLLDFWEWQGSFGEGRQWLDGLLARAPEWTVTRARALATAGYLALQQSDLLSARASAEAALTLAEELGDTWSRGMAVHQLSHVAGGHDGDERREGALLEESLAIMEQTGDPHASFSARQCLGLFALRQGDESRAERLFEQNLTAARARGASVYTLRPLRQLGELAQRRGDHEQARQRYAESLVGARETGATANLGWALQRLGDLARLRGDYAQAHAALEESLVARRKRGNAPEIGAALHSLAALARWEGDVGRARELLEQCLAIWQQVGNARAIGETLRQLGQVAEAEGEPGRGKVWYEESLQRSREAGDEHLAANVLGNLASLAGRQGNEAQARDLWRQSWSILRSCGHHRCRSWALANLAVLAGRQGAHARAAWLLGAATALYPPIRVELAPDEGREYDTCLAAAVAALGQESFDAQRVRRQAMTTEEILHDVLNTEAPVPTATQTGAPPRGASGK